MAMLFIPVIVWLSVINSEDPLTRNFEDAINDLFQRKVR